MVRQKNIGTYGNFEQKLNQLTCFIDLYIERKQNLKSAFLFTISFCFQIIFLKHTNMEYTCKAKQNTFLLFSLYLLYGMCYNLTYFMRIPPAKGNPFYQNEKKSL